MADATINIRAADKTQAAFASVNRSMLKMSKATEGLKGQMMGAGFGLLGAGTIFELARREIVETIKTIDDIPGVPAETIASVERMNILFGEAQQGVRAFIAEAIAGFSNMASGLGVAIGAMVYGTDAASDALTKLDKESQAAIDKRAFEKLEKQLAPLRRELKSVEDQSAKALAPLYGATLKGREQLDALREAVNRIHNELAQLEGMDTEEGLRRRIELNKELATMATQLHSAELQALEAQREAAKILGMGFEKAIVNGEKFSDVLKQIARDLLQLAIRNTITNPLISALGGSSLLGGLFGGGKAIGGPVSRGKAYMVGENGPEMFMPSQSGSIVPNHAMSSGSGATYYIDARGADRAGMTRLEQMIRETQASIRPIAIQSVLSASARGAM